MTAEVLHISCSDTEPFIEVTVNGQALTILGTAHVSRISMEQVTRWLETGAFDAIAVELCPARYQALSNPEALAQMDLFQVIRAGQAPLVAANLALGAYQQRLARQLGLEPGAEIRRALEYAKRNTLPLWLIDRDIGTTLRRTYRSVSLWQRLTLLSGLVASVFTRESVSEQQIERLKRGDMLESTFTQFAGEAPTIYRTLIDERDRFMAARLQQETGRSSFDRVLVVVGAGHLKGLQKYLESPEEDAPGVTIDTLNRLPPPHRWPKALPWLLVGLIVMGFIIGFWRNSQIGLAMVADWVLINGTLAALGAAIAAAHPLTIIGAFLAAPLTSLNPTVGAGMVTAALELWLRKPRVADFHDVRRAAASLRGWWHNRVTRTLLVFMLSTLGSAVGTYVAGYRIIERLL